MKILYEDKQVIVCLKEAGLAVQSASLTAKDLVSILKNELRSRNPEKEPYLGVVHRLDQPVEGILVFAKTPAAAKELSKQVQDGTMRKIYRARVHAETCPAAEASLEDWLRKDGKTNTSAVVPAKSAGAKKALLDYKLLSYDEQEKTALLEIHLHTGRHHQIRVQMASAGMPLCGDRKYGGQVETNVENFRRFPALCAYELTFRHPKGGKQVTFTVAEEDCHL